jgi:hypothetical protein
MTYPPDSYYRDMISEITKAKDISVPLFITDTLKEGIYALAWVPR